VVPRLSIVTVDNILSFDCRVCCVMTKELCERVRISSKTSARCIVKGMAKEDFRNVDGRMRRERCRKTKMTTDDSQLKVSVIARRAKDHPPVASLILSPKAIVHRSMQSVYLKSAKEPVQSLQHAAPSNPNRPNCKPACRKPSLPIQITL
jgi:hypothetical protein